MLNAQKNAVTGGAGNELVQPKSRQREPARFSTRLKSPLEGVSADAWARFVSTLEAQPIGTVSDSGGLGSYDIRPRRLVELGYARGLRYTRTDKGRQIHVCEFIPPWTQTRFLTDAIAQYVALSKSISMYYRAVQTGELKKPDEISMAGTLAILHVGGRGALEAWPKLFEHTRALYEATRGAF